MNFLNDFILFFEFFKVNKHKKGRNNENSHKTLN